MNYYPNYYMNNNNNYPYNGNNSNQYMQPQVQPYMAINQQLPQQTLNGKIVDSADVVRATEVPIGGYGIFPKADLSEIYIKSWNNNGTTSVITFKPEPPVLETMVSPQASNDTIMEILNKINNLEIKIDNLSTPVSKLSTQSIATKKEIKSNEY